MFPPLYHAHNSHNPEDLPFWQELAQQMGDPVLELGCGTGRVLSSLASAGHQVYGVDNDPEMLEFLRSQLPKALAPRIHIVQENIAQFSLEIKFPLIILPCNTFTILERETRLRTLINVYQHLQLNGVFAVSMPNPFILKQLPRYAAPEIEESFPHPNDGEPVQVSSAWARYKHQFAITWIYDHLLANGEVERFTYKVKQNIIPIENIEREFQDARLQITTRMGDFDRSDFNHNSTYLILLAQKEKEREF